MNRGAGPVNKAESVQPAGRSNAVRDVRLHAPGLTPAGATATVALIRGMARELGLDPGTLDITIDEAAGRALRVHGAWGRTHGNLVELDPRYFDPGRHAGRALLAHELTHAAQSQLTATAPAPLRLVEAEARANALAAGIGRALTQPLQRLSGAAFEAPQAEAATVLPPLASLSNLVARNYRREREHIRRLLAGIVSNGDVEQVLRILEPLTFETATALIGSLESEDRLCLFDELNRPHYARFRTQIIAAMAALSDAEMGQQDEALLEPVHFDALGPAELIAVQRAFRLLPRPAQTALSEGDRAADFRALRCSPPGEYDRAAVERALAQQEEERSVSVILASADLRSRVYRLSVRLQDLLRDADADKARSALQLIADLSVQPAADPRMAAEVVDPTAAEQAEQDRRSGRNAETAVGEATTTPAPRPEAEPATPADGLTMAALRLIASDLDEQGAIDHLIDALREEDRQIPALRDAFRLLMSAREASRNLALVEELLNPGWWIFGWVDRHEAMLAYDIVMSMPLVEREHFRQLEGGAALRRMIDALPDEFRRSPDFQLPEVARTADGRLIEADRLYAPGGLRDSEAQLVGETLAEFRDPERARDTESRLNRLLAIARLEQVADNDALSPRRDAVLATVVRRLDAEGLLEPFLQHLTPDQLAERDNAQQLMLIFAARDPMLAREHILRLLDARNFLFISLDSVEPGEAFLAFHLIRALPPADRAAIETADGGAPWGRMLEQLSNRTLAEAGFTYFRAGLGRDGTNAVRSRLDDDRLWNGDHNDELIAVIELARATGEFNYVFETSRLRREAGLAVPAEAVSRYRLYDPAAGRTSPRPVETDLDIPGGSVGGMLFGGDWRELDIRYVYSAPVDILGSEYSDASVSAIRATVDLEQLQALQAGDRLHTMAEVARSGEPRPPLTPESREGLLDSSNVVDVVLDLEHGIGEVRASEIRLDNTRYLSSGFMLRTGAVTLGGLRLQIRFERGDLIALTSVAAELGRLAVETPVYSSDDTAIAARRASLTTLHAAVGDFSQQEPEQPIVGYLFGMILAAIWRTYVSHRQILENPLERAALFDRIDLSFDNLVIDELQTSGGQRLGQTTISEARIAAATNRAAYQRLLVQSLTRRLEAATDAATRERLQQQLTTASAEAARLEPLETRYRELVRRMNRQEGHLSDDESRELARLQEDEDLAVGGRMGAIVDIGQIRVEGIDGSVRANDLELNGLHGEGEFRNLFGFTVEQLTTEQQISRFVEFGPEALQTHLAGEQPSDTSFALEIPSVSIGGLVVQGEIPSSRTVQEAELELPSTPEFAAERARLQALVTRLQAYEELRQRREPNAPADRIAHRRRLMEERRALAELFGSAVDQLDARAITLGAQPSHEGRLAPTADGQERAATRARGNIGIGSLDLRGVRHGDIHAERIGGTGLHGAVQLRSAGFGAYADPDTQFEVAVFGGDSLVIDNARIGEGPNRAERIQIDGFGGVARLNSDGLLVEDFVIDTLTVQDAHYRTATSYVWSQGATEISGIHVHMRIPFEPAEAAGGDAAADPALSRLDTSTLHIERLYIERISADQLGYRGYAESGSFSKEVIVESGYIGGIDITHFTLRMPEDGDMGYSGGVSIRSLDQVQFQARIGESMQLRGELNSGERDAAHPAIDVTIGSAEEIYVDLDQIDLSQGAVDLRTSSGRGRVLVRQAEFSGSVGMIGNRILVRNFVAPMIDMPSVHWTTSAGAEISADNARLRNFRLNLDYTTEDNEHSTVVINELYVGAFGADRLTYEDPPAVRVTLSERSGENGAALPMIAGLVLQDLTLSMGPDSFSMSGGHGRIDNAEVFVSAMQQAQAGTAPNRYDAITTMFADVSARGISFADLGYGSEGLDISGGIESLEAQGGFDIAPVDSAAAPPGASTIGGDFSVSQGRIGSFRYGNGLVQIGPNGSEGLIIDEIVLQSLSFNGGDYELRPIATETAEAARPGSAAAGTMPSSVTARGLRLNMDLHLHRDTEEEARARQAGDAEHTPGMVDRIDIHQLHFDSVALQGYRLFLRQKGIYIDVPAGLDTSIQNIDLHGPLPDQPFTIRLDTPSPTLLGSVSTGALLAQQIGVQMGNSLRARLDFEAESANVGFLEATDPASTGQGPIAIDLANWSATNILAYIGEGTSTRLRAGRMLGDGGIGGSHLDVELAEDGSVGVRLRGLWARGFELRDQELGAALVLGSMTMPDEDQIEYTSGPSGTTTGNQHTRVRIEYLDIDTADFFVNNLSHMIHGLGGPDVEHALTTTDRAPDPDAEPDTDPALLDQSMLNWIRNHQALFDSLQGHISADVQFPTGAVTSDVGTLHPQIDLDIENGSLNIDQMEDQLSRIDELAGTTVGLANLKFDPNTAEPTLVFGVGGHVPVPESDPMGMSTDEPVEADLHYNLYQWHMNTDEMEVIRASRRIGISRLLQVEQGNFDPAAEPEQPDPDAIPQSMAQQFRGLRVNNFALQLSTDNTDPLPISLGDYGSLELAPQALQNLIISGNLQPYNYDLLPAQWREYRVFQSMHRDSTGRPGNFGLSLDQLALQALNIRLPAFGNYVGGGIEGNVTIDGVQQVSLDFRGLVPRQLSGRVGSVQLRDVEINLEQFVPYGPPAPQPDPAYRDVPVFREGEDAP